MNGRCTCNPPHSRAVHRNQRGRCLVPGCRCLSAPPQTKRMRAATAPPGLVTVDERGVVVGFQKPQPTPAQRILRESESRKLERRLARKIELAGLPVPQLEYYWAKSEGRRFHSEFAWPEQRVLAEVQGGIWATDPGRHNRGAGYEADCARDNLGVLLGWRIFRFTERMIANGIAIETLSRALLNERTDTHTLSLGGGA